jgi:glutamyl-Q tRNA(Asp) synthetase
MEDLDRPRVVAGSATAILRTLELFGLTWDGAVEYQSARTQHYAEALERLRSTGMTFECSCSRRELESESAYPGNCRAGPRRPGPTALRFRMPDESVTVEDRLQGTQAFRLSELGDVIVRRRDGAFAYQLAVVVDDALQGVTDVVRGSDLLASTPWQIALQQALRLPTPRYAHLPLVTESSGEKLAKSTHSIALDAAAAGRQLHTALRMLHQQPPAELEVESAAVILEWAVAHWRPQRLRGVREVGAVAYGTSV